MEDAVASLAEAKIPVPDDQRESTLSPRNSARQNDSVMKESDAKASADPFKR